MNDAVALAPENITGLILAGGRGQRMGGQDKGLLRLDDTPLVQLVLARLAPQVGTVAISANRHLAEYRSLGCPVWPDRLPDWPGPLAGMLTALEKIDTDWLLTVPVDSPWLPGDLAWRLGQAASRTGHSAAVATLAGERQPAFNLVHRRVTDDLADWLASGERRLGGWLARLDAVPVDFSDQPDAFENINTPQDLEHLQRRLAHAH